MPTVYPPEFRREVIAVARKGEQSIAQIARSFGISESCLHRWLRIAEREESAQSEQTFPPGADLEAENRELCKRTARLEQENEILAVVHNHEGWVATATVTALVERVVVGRYWVQHPCLKRCRRLHAGSPTAPPTGARRSAGADSPVPRTAGP
jgi:transposase